MRPKMKLLVPLAVLAVGVAGSMLLFATRPRLASKPAEEIAPLVRVVEAQPRDVRFTVRTHGSVVPRTESDLVVQVAGEVVWVSPALVSGGFFEKGDPLVRIDRSDYEVELESTRAAIARTKSEFARAKKELARQHQLAEKRVASEARIDDAENAARVADAVLREAQARLERARRDLARTELRAPFEGRVRRENVDVGQFVSRGQAIATLYAVDYAEVRLPIPDRELRYLELPLGRVRAAEGAESEGPKVLLRAEFAGRQNVWTGRVVRTEGEIDPKSRMVNVVARVEDPYDPRGEDGERQRSPLAVGLFVEAEISGRRAEGVFVLPRAALRPAQLDLPAHVHVVDADGRLRIRPVEVLRAERENVILGDGLVAGEHVSISPLQLAVDGMKVRIAGEAAVQDDARAARTDDDRAERTIEANMEPDPTGPLARSKP